MTKFRNAMLARGIAGERGIALVTVIGIGSVLTILIVTAVAFSIGGLKNARSDQDQNAALAAAYAGVEEYQSRLANDIAYQQYGNPASTFSNPAGTADDSKVTLPTGTQANSAFGVGRAGEWATIVGSGGAAQFRYEVDNSSYGINGNISIRATGRSGAETRSIVADLKQQGFIDYLYFTDYEIQDPAQSGLNYARCAKYHWLGRPSNCSDLAFLKADVLDGPVHSNDAVRICGATFRGPFTSAYVPASGPNYLARTSDDKKCSGAKFELDGYPRYSPVVGMPQTNSQLKKETRYDLPVIVPRPGCLYTGPTEIVFHDDGRMTVRSPWTKKTQIKGEPASGGRSVAECGIAGPGSNKLGDVDGATIDVPKNNVVYVQNVPTVSTDPNYTSASSQPSKLACAGEGDDEGTGSTTGNGIGYPRLKEVAPNSSSYGCRSGDVFVEGTVKGNVTVAAENYVYIVGDVEYRNPQDDMIGLVGNNAVWIWNPVECTKEHEGGGCKDYDALLQDDERTVDAAIMSVAHTFQVQNYKTSGFRGTLNITGGIAQKFRGFVYWQGNGYVKDYDYDARFRYTAPPKFLSPVTITYGVNVWVEVSPIFDADGGYR